jgi:hypothetical protein
MDNEEIEKIVEQYVEMSQRVLERKDQERALGGMLTALPPPRITNAMLVEHWCHRYLLFWFELLTLPALLAILWRVW